MRFAHPAHPEFGLRLAYGLNLYPSRDARGVLAGLRAIALPLRARLARGAGAFGVGMWLPARAAREFVHQPALLAELAELCASAELEPFTCNAFPHGEFHGPGLKQRVFEPSWKQRERLEFTLDVARVAVALRALGGAARPAEHLSVSTHSGMFAAALAPGDRELLADGFVRAASALAELEHECGERVVLALEPEPRSNANDTRELVEFLALVRQRARGAAEDAVRRHLGACLDACHAAVEFEVPEEALERATAAGAPLGKLQFSSALKLRPPHGIPALLALDEPVYLHQVTGRRGNERLRVLDLPELARAWQGGAWSACDEWRCHFHVPVDLDELGGAAGLGTTRSEADALLARALAAPERWGVRELHVEVETYTWNLFTPAQTGSASALEGLERELRHVLERLRLAGWCPAGWNPCAPSVDTPQG